MAVLFHFEVHTPKRLFFSDSAEAIILTLLDGEAAVYANHVPYTAPVVPCLLKIKDKNGNWKTAFVSDGILEVTEVKNILLVEAAEWPGEIDYDRAKMAREEAEKTLSEGGMKFEMVQANSRLRRAKMRILAHEGSGGEKA